MRLTLRTAIPIVLLLGAGLVAAAGGASCAQEKPEKEVVELKTLVSQDVVRPGDFVKAAFVLNIQPGYHINDNAPADEFLFATSIALEDCPGVEVVELYYPKGHRGRFAYSEAELVVYEGETVLGALLKVKDGAAPGPLKLKGTFSYQACNNTSCLPPKENALEFVLPVAKAGSPFHEVHSEVFAKLPLAAPKK